MIFSCTVSQITFFSSWSPVRFAAFCLWLLSRRTKTPCRALPLHNIPHIIFYRILCWPFSRFSLCCPYKPPTLLLHLTLPLQPCLYLSKTILYLYNKYLHFLTSILLIGRKLLGYLPHLS